MAVVGGAKVADKLGVLKALLHHVDALVVGGGMAFTFLAAQGHDIGGSLVDPDRIDECAELLASGTPIHLPTDIVALEPGAEFGCDCTGGEVRTVGADVPDGWQGLDIGPETVAAYAEAIAGAGTVLWNGPMGVFEDQRFCAGTAGVAAAVAACPGYTVVGGGRQCRRGRRARPGRSDQLHLHRRRCVARAPRVRRPARPRRTARRAERPRTRRPVSAAGPRDAGRWSAATGRCTSTTWRRSTPPGTSACGSSRPTWARSTCPCTRPSPTCARCSRSSRARGSRSPSAPRTARSRTPGPSPGRSVP